MSTNISVSLLLKRKNNVETGMSNSRASIDTVNVEIDRLEEALRKLEINIHQLKQLRRLIDSFDVIKSKWEGSREKRFIKTYSSYNISFNHYYSEMIRAREKIEEDIERAREKRESAYISLGNLQRTLNNINRDIELLRDRRE